MEFLIVFQFFVSVSEEVFNISRNSPLDFEGNALSSIIGGTCPGCPRVYAYVFFTLLTLI